MLGLRGIEFSHGTESDGIKGAGELLGETFTDFNTVSRGSPTPEKSAVNALNDASNLENPVQASAIRLLR
jgi:hypothetical protein